VTEKWIPHQVRNDSFLPFHFCRGSVLRITAWAEAHPAFSISQGSPLAGMKERVGQFDYEWIIIDL
jgi:hypothetical protein